MKKNKFVCCICGREVKGWSNNPAPIVNEQGAKCCDVCNWEKVIPARISTMRKEKNG